MKRTLITVWVSVLVLLCIFEIVPQVAAIFLGKKSQAPQFMSSSYSSEYQQEAKSGDTGYFTTENGKIITPADLPCWHGDGVIENDAASR